MISSTLSIILLRRGILSWTLAPPKMTKIRTKTIKDTEEWSWGVFEDFTKDIEFLLHEQTGSSQGESDSSNGAVGSVSSTEGIVDVDITELGQRGSEFVDLVLFNLDLDNDLKLTIQPSCLLRP